MIHASGKGGVIQTSQGGEWGGGIAEPSNGVFQVAVEVFFVSCFWVVVSVFFVSIPYCSLESFLDLPLGGKPV